MQNQRVRNWSARGDSRFETGLLVLALSLVALAARAEQPSALSGATGSGHRIEIFLVGELGSDPTLPRRITSWFDRTAFRVTVTSAPKLDVDRVLKPRGDFVLEAWVALVDKTQARLYFSFAEPHDHRTVYLLRDLRLEAGLDEIGAERIAEVLHLSVLALIEGQAESPREELETTLARDASMLSAQDQPPETSSGPSAVQPENARRDARSRSLSSDRPAKSAAKSSPFELGLGYGGSFRGDEGLWHGPRVSLHLQGAVIGAAAVVEGVLPSTHTFDSITLRTYAVSAALTAELRRAFTQSVAAEAFVGPGIDIVNYAPERSADSEVTVGDGATEGRPKIVLGAALIFGRASPRVSVVGSASIALARTHYDVVVDGQSHVVGRPWVVFPAAGAELRF